MADFQAAAFRVDVTVPMGHPLCGGWIKPAAAVVDPLYASGVVIRGAGKPIVLCAVDWTGICNDAHIAWRVALAKAAGTEPERVAVHCTHPHNAPFADITGQKLVVEHDTGGSIVDLKFLELAGARTAEAIAKLEFRPFTHLGHAAVKVDKVASNRRVIGPDGKLIAWRGSATKRADFREMPDGVIDPELKTVALFDGDRRIAVIHRYACHPMSYYGDGGVTSDFPGIARDKRTAADGCLHIYFTGCSGNVAAGKYNDGSKENRAVLTKRIHDAMLAAEKSLARVAVDSIEWRTKPVKLPARTDSDADMLLKVIADPKAGMAFRHRAAMKLSYRRRADKEPIILSALRIGKVALLHLPAESFIEYQLHAASIDPTLFVSTAAYGDGGPWYIPTVEAFPQGGYEPSVAFAEPESETILRDGIKALLTA